jgi:hypothetical protein
MNKWSLLRCAGAAVLLCPLTGIAQWGYGPSSGGPGEVVSMDPGGAPPSNMNYGTANYSSYGGGPPPSTQSLGATSGLSNPGSGAGSMLTYGQLEGFYKFTDFEDSRLDGGSGLGVSLSAELFRPFYLKGSFDWASGGGSGLKNNYDFVSVSMGGGAYFALTDRFHVFAEVGGNYANLTADKSSLEFSDGSVYLTPGLRFAATDSLELDLSVTASSADDYDSRSVDLSGYYRLFSAMDVGVGTGFGDQTRTYFAGIRFRW